MFAGNIFSPTKYDSHTYTLSSGGGYKLIYERAPVYDNIGADLSEHFVRCIRFIERAKYYGSVLVHWCTGRAVYVVALQPPRGSMRGSVSTAIFCSFGVGHACVRAERSRKVIDISVTAAICDVFQVLAVPSRGVGLTQWQAAGGDAHQQWQRRWNVSKCSWSARCRAASEIGNWSAG